MTDTRIGLYGAAATCAALNDTLASCDGAVCAAIAEPGEQGWQDLLARDDLDAIMVGADKTTNIPDKVAQVLQRGLHLYIAGDAARTLEDVIAIRRAEAATANLVLKISALHRQHASLKAAQQMLVTGELGKLLFIRGVYGDEGQEQGRGVLMRLGMPMLDLIHAFAGPIEDVKSLITGDSTDLNAMALLRTHAGVMATVHASSSQWRRTFRLELGFSAGYIWLDGLNGSNLDFGPEMLISARAQVGGHGGMQPNPDEAIQEYSAQDTLAADVAELVNAIRNSTAIQTGTTTQLFDAMNVVQRIYANDLAYDPAAMEAR